MKKFLLLMLLVSSVPCKADLNIPITNENITYIGLGYMSASVSRLFVSEERRKDLLWAYGVGFGASALVATMQQATSGQPWRWDQFNWSLVGGYAGVRLSW